MEEAKFKTFTLTGDDEVTKRIWDGAGCPETHRELAMEVAEGNPGCMTYLVELYNKVSDFEFRVLLGILKGMKLKGSDLYSYIKKNTLDGSIAAFKRMSWI